MQTVIPIKEIILMEIGMVVERIPLLMVDIIEEIGPKVLSKGKVNKKELGELSQVRGKMENAKVKLVLFINLVKSIKEDFRMTILLVMGSCIILDMEDMKVIIWIIKNMEKGNSITTMVKHMMVSGLMM